MMWYASTDTLPFDMDSGEWLFVRKVLGLVREDVILGDYSSASEVLAKLRHWQVENAERTIFPPIPYGRLSNCTIPLTVPSLRRWRPSPQGFCFSF